MCNRFIFSPLRGFTQHGLHNPDLGALAAVDIRREIEKFKNRWSNSAPFAFFNASICFGVNIPGMRG